MKRIFVSGPYTLGDVAQNVKRAMDCSDELIRMGFAPFCPHLSHFLHMNKQQPYEKWLEIDIAFLKTCHAVIRLSGESKGADGEVEHALKLGIPVFYTMEDLVFYFQKQLDESRR